MAGPATVTMFTVLVRFALTLVIFAQPIYIDPSIVRMYAHNGFLNLTSTADGPFVYQTTLNAPLTIELFMSDQNTQIYDYMLEGCTANGYTFIDQHSCMLCDAIFLRQIETPLYWQHNGLSKRTLIHLLAYQPIDTDVINIECFLLLTKCQGCAQRACERSLTPGKDILNFQRFTKSIAIKLEGGNYGSIQPNRGSWYEDEDEGLPWWIILIIVLFALLLIAALVLLVCCCLRRRRRRDVGPTDNYRTPPESLSQTYARPEPNVSRSNSAHIATNK